MNAIINNKKVNADQFQKDFSSKIDDIFEFAPIGIYQADSEGNLITANPELAWMLGYGSSQNLVEQMNDITSQMFAETEKAEEFFFTLFEAEELNRFRCKLKKKNGSSFWARSYAKITKDNDGRINGFYGFTIDITSTVRSEKKMLQLNDELKALNNELKILSVMDGLTKISNRRMFDETLSTESKRLRREQGWLSLVLCDIDFFKPYNDTYGHQAGDDTLYKVAQAIKNSVNRPADFVARYGGEEFVIILPNTDAKGAITVAEKARKAVIDIKIIHESSTVNEYVTLSLGIASTIPKSDNTPEELIAIADQALYTAKENGRNRVVMKT